jgi:hypothetical protein
VYGGAKWRESGLLSGVSRSCGRLEEVQVVSCTFVTAGFWTVGWTAETTICICPFEAGYDGHAR